jgi:hypothetical protein
VATLASGPGETFKATDRCGVTRKPTYDNFLCSLEAEPPPAQSGALTGISIEWGGLPKASVTCRSDDGQHLFPGGWLGWCPSPVLSVASWVPADSVGCMLMGREWRILLFLRPSPLRQGKQRSRHVEGHTSHSSCS